MPEPLVHVLNGPNLNLLGSREPEIYGAETLADIGARLDELAGELGLRVEMRQTNHEGELIDWIQQADRVPVKAIILNAGGFTHTSVAIHDAIRAITAPVIEVHLSNPYAREDFRHRSYVAPAAKASICGLGAYGYEVALQAAARL